MHRVTKLTVENIGPIENTVIELDKPLLLFYGEIKQGKSTLLNAVKWCLGAAWPEDIIRHGSREARVKLDFVGGSVSRSWYRGKDGTTKARDIAFILNNEPVAKPAKELAKFLNPFLLDQDHLRNMSEPERKAYFAQILAVDTSELDIEAAALDEQAKSLRAELKTYGDLRDFIPIPAGRVDLKKLWEDRQVIVDAHAKEVHAARQAMAEKKMAYRRQYEETAVENRARDAHNRNIQAKEDRIAAIKEQIKRLEAECFELEAEIVPLEKPLDLPAEPDVSEFERIISTPPDTTTIDQRIQEAGKINAEADAWERDCARVKERDEKTADLAKCEARLRAIKQDKAAKLKETAANCPVPGLEFDESGSVIYEGTTAGMLSTSQIMKLSSALSALYPPGFGIELVDRAESLGQSIYLFIDRAKREDKTILATIVGEEPAKSPPEVGVFVVEAGKVKQKQLL